MGLVAAVWYLAGRGRLSRSGLAPALVVVALALQLLGVLLERDDPTAFGDNMGAILFFVSFSALALWQWLRGPSGTDIPG